MSKMEPGDLVAIMSENADYPNIIETQGILVADKMGLKDWKNDRHWTKGYGHGAEHVIETPARCIVALEITTGWGVNRCKEWCPHCFERKYVKRVTLALEEAHAADILKHAAANKAARQAELVEEIQRAKINWVLERVGLVAERWHDEQTVTLCEALLEAWNAADGRGGMYLPNIPNIPEWKALRGLEVLAEVVGETMREEVAQ